MRDLLNAVLPRNVGPTRDTQETARRTDAQSDLRMGVVTAVTTTGITVQVGAQSIDAAHLDSYAPAVGDAVALMAVQDSWLALGRVVGPGNPTDGSAASSAVGPSLLTGASITGTSAAALASTAGAAVTVSKYDQTYYHPTNHVVLAVMGFDWTASAATAVATFFVRENVSNAQFGFARYVPNNTIDNYHTIFAVLPASLGGQQRRVTLEVSASGGTITVKDGISLAQGFLYLMDLGDASFVVQK